MATFPRYRQDVVDNPVQRAERSHLLRTNMSRFWRAVYAITMFAIVAPILWGFGIHFHRTLEFSLGLLFFINVVMIFAVEMRIMNHASDSIKREFQGKTWDLLILTGVDTWRLILGKWVGSIRGNRREIVYLYALRVSTFFWGMVAHFLSQDGFSRWRYYRSDVIPAQLWDIRFDAQALIIGAVVMAVFLALEVMLVSALPMALSLFRQTRKGATWIALGLRIGVPIAFGMLIAFIFFELPYAFGTVERWYIDYPIVFDAGLIGFGTVLADNGFILSVIPLSNGESYSGYYAQMNAFALMQIIGIGLYLLWIWIMLRLAKFAAHRYNVSEPGFIAKGKPKRLIKAEASTVVESSAPPVTQPKPHSPRETNLLGIQNPGLYRCEVMRYEASHLEIAVYRMTENTPEFIIQFTDVSFFTGAMNWTNAKFERLEDKHLQQYASNQKLEYDKLSQESKLYVVQSQGNRTRIIATDVQIEILTPEPA
jgi:hypothetical protein